MSYYYFLEEVPVVQRWNFAVPNFVIIIWERFLGVSFARRKGGGEGGGGVEGMSKLPPVSKTCYD